MPRLCVTPELVALIAMAARQVDARVAARVPGVVTTASPDERVRAVLSGRRDHPPSAELIDALQSLGRDGVLDLIAIVRLGRGDFQLAEWGQVRRRLSGSAMDLIATPMLGFYLEEGLRRLGMRP